MQKANFTNNAKRKVKFIAPAVTGWSQNKLLGNYILEDSFHQQIGLKFEEETNKMLHLEHGFVWC